jgi:hypothetical protein
VAESSLDKVLRLAGGITRSYTRMENGRVQRVGAYTRIRRVAWGSLKAGNVVQIAGARYKVVQARVPQTPFKPAQPGPNTKGTTSGKNTGSQGQGVNTGGPASTGSAGQGVNTGAVTGSTIAQAALGGAKLPFGTPTVTNLLASLVTGKQFYVYLPQGQEVTVIT